MYDGNHVRRWYIIEELFAKMAYCLAVLINDHLQNIIINEANQFWPDNQKA